MPTIRKYSADQARSIPFDGFVVGRIPIGYGVSAIDRQQCVSAIAFNT